MNKKRKLNIPYLLMFALLQFPLRFQRFTFITYIFIYVIPALYLLLHLQWVISFFGRIVKRGNLLPLTAIVLLFIESCLWPMFHETYDFTALSMWWRTLLFLLIKNIFLIAYYEISLPGTRKSATDYIRYYTHSVSLYVCGSLIMLIPAIRAPCLSALYQTERQVWLLTLPAYYTRFGWNGWSGFGQTIQCSISCFFICLLVLFSPQNKAHPAECLYTLLFAFVGNMLYGRSGLVISLIIVFVSLMYMFGRGNYRLFFRIAVSSGVVCLAISLAVLYMPALHTWSEWAFSMFSNFIEKGEISDSTRSVEKLMYDMYWVPSFHTLLLGDGRYTGKDGAYYMHTDSGIMRQVLFYGVINYILGIMSTFQLTAPLYRAIAPKRNQRISAQIVSLLLFSTLLIPFEIKGETYSWLISTVAPVAYLKSKRVDLPNLLNGES